MVDSLFISSFSEEMMSKKGFCVKLLVFVILLAGADQLIGGILKDLYFHQKGEDYFYTTKTLDMQDSTVLILGSSRARNHYNPRIIRDSLGMSCYNAGRSGCFLTYQSAQLDMILDRYKPEVILLEVTPYDMNPGESDYDRLSGLLPYQHHASWRKTIEKKSVFEPYKCLSAIYPYNSLLIKMMANLKDRGGFRSDGFQPLEGCWTGAYGETNGGAANVVSEQKKQEMIHIVNTCKDNQIRLVMVTSPFYGKFTSSTTLQTTDSICKANDIPYCSFLNHPAFKDASLFATGDHLNEKGAIMFSAMIAHWLRKEIQ